MRSGFARVVLCAAVAVSASGCFQQIGKSLGDGLMQAINEQAPAVGEGIVKGAGNGVRNDVLVDPTTQKLNDTVNKVVGEAVDTAVTHAANDAAAQLPRIREEAIGQPTREQLKLMAETLLALLEERARHTSRGVITDVGNGLRDQVLNDATNQKLNALLLELLTTTRGQAGLMRDDLLGQNTDAHVQQMVQTAMREVVRGTDDIRRQAHEELSFVQRNTAETLIVMGVLAGAAVAFFWWQKEKNRRLLNLLTRHIAEITADGQRTELLGRIESQAQALGVKNQLRDAMVQQGLVNERTGTR